MLTIGFTEKYYTLWSVGEPYEEKHYYNGLCIGSTWKQDCHYMQNLSMDFDKAKAKAETLGDYQINLELRGHSSFSYTISSDIKNRDEYYPHDCFSFGRLESVKIMEVDDIWQLERAYREERSPRRRVYARRRLIELGRLVRYTWYDKKTYNANWGKSDESGYCLEPDYQTKKIRYNYATPERFENSKFTDYVASLENGHLFEDGAKVELEIKRIPKLSFSFNGSFGRTYIETYETKCGKIVKYMGSSPLDIEENFTKVQATIKHSEYNGVDETKLIRIKDLTDYSHMFLPNTDESAKIVYKLGVDSKTDAPKEFLELFKNSYKKFKFKKTDYSQVGELNSNGLYRICNILGI